MLRKLKQTRYKTITFYDSDDEHLFIGAVTSDDNRKFEENGNE